MRRLGNWTAFALVLAAVTTAPPTRADVPGPPDSPESKRVPVTVEIDWGVFADRISKRHVVAPGETLRTIAAKELGDAARSKAIAENNPDVVKDPNLIRAGDVLWLPPIGSFEKQAKPPAPATPAPAPTPAPPPAPTPPPTPNPKAAPPGGTATDLAPWYDAFWSDFSGPGAPLPAWQVSADWPSGKENLSGSIALVPHSATVASAPGMGGPGLAKAPWVRIGTDGLVHRDDPTVRIVGKYRLTGIAASALTADFERVRLDAEGKPVTKTWVVRPPGNYPADEPAPGAPPRPTPPGSPPAPPAIGMASATASATVVVAPLPKEPAAPPEPPADVSRWPASTGLVVAGMGAALVAALVLIRRQKAAAAKAATDGPTDPPSEPPVA